MLESFSHPHLATASVIAYGFANLDLKNKLCERDLVLTKILILENPVAWPIRSEYAAGLSHWFYEAEKKHGLTVEALKEQYDARSEQPTCEVEFSQEEDEADDYARIAPLNLFFPFAWFAAAAIAACALQVYAHRTKRQKRRSLMDHRFLARNSELGLTSSMISTGKKFSAADLDMPEHTADDDADKVESCQKEASDEHKFKITVRNRAALNQRNGFESDFDLDKSKNNDAKDAEDDAKEMSRLGPLGCEEELEREESGDKCPKYEEGQHWQSDQDGNGSSIAPFLTNGATDDTSNDCELAKSQLLDELFRRYMAIEQRKKA